MTGIDKRKTTGSTMCSAICKTSTGRDQATVCLETLTQAAWKKRMDRCYKRVIVLLIAKTFQFKKKKDDAAFTRLVQEAMLHYTLLCAVFKRLTYLNHPSFTIVMKKIVLSSILSTDLLSSTGCSPIDFYLLCGYNCTPIQPIVDWIQRVQKTMPLSS